MIIDSFIIEGFSNIEHIRLDVGEINALIAPNGYGKSNVLSAISFGLMYLNANEETKGQMLRSRFLPINVSIKGKKSPDEIHKALGNIMWEYVGMGRTEEGLKKAAADGVSAKWRSLKNHMPKKAEQTTEKES